MAARGVRVLGVCVWALLVVAMVEARPPPLLSIAGGEEEGEGEGVSTGRKLFKLVSNTLVLPYHDGPLLTGAVLNVYIVWYGAFAAAQKAVVADFFASLAAPGAEHASVASWWKLTAGYKDSKNDAPAAAVALAGQVDDAYSAGKTLRTADVEELVLAALAAVPADPHALYFVLTAADVQVDGFCMSACASHAVTAASPRSKNFALPYSWVGNSASQCPGYCAWPFALPQYGPQNAKALVAPNADAGIDGMVINLAAMLAGAATNPFNSGFFQGDASAPLEAATACTGIYGAGAFPGDPGQLIVDPITSASYNALGVGTRKYLLPALWDPATLACTPVP